MDFVAAMFELDGQTALIIRRFNGSNHCSFEGVEIPAVYDLYDGVSSTASVYGLVGRTLV